MDEMTGHESAAALADSSMWEEVNGENPPMMVEGDLIWRGAGRCANPVTLAQAAVDEIIRLTRERDEARAACSEACTEAGSLTAALEQERTLSSHLQERATAAEARVRELQDRLARIEAAAAATAETLDALIYWHDCGDIDRSWWEAAREQLAALRAVMGETK